jgi:Ca-activated chloride channel family protein
VHRRLWTLAFALSALAASLHAQRPPFRSGVDLVSLTVTATGAGGRYVSDLQAADFTVLEDGKKQDLTFFERATTPLAVSLLIDSSTSMMRQMPLAQQAASDFVGRLRPGDVAQVIDFDRRVQVLQPFTNDREILDRAIRRVTARGSTSMFNAIYIALRELGALAKPAGDQIRRDVIVVLSDGEDTSSLVTFDHVLDGAKRSQSVIYSIGLGGGTPPARREATHPEFALRTLAQETGGRLFLPRSADDLRGIYNEIADELTSQYVLGYVSNSTARPGWRAVSVRVGREDVRARARTGYYAGSRPAGR